MPCLGQRPIGRACDELIKRLQPWDASFRVSRCRRQKGTIKNVREAAALCTSQNGALQVARPIALLALDGVDLPRVSTNRTAQPPRILHCFSLSTCSPDRLFWEEQLTIRSRHGVSKRSIPCSRFRNVLSLAFCHV